MKKLLVLYLYVLSGIGLPVYAQYNTQLLEAAEQGKDSLVFDLLNKNADINTVSGDGYTPLMYAVQNGHYTTAKLCLLKGASVTHKNTEGMDALLVAAIFGQDSIIELLISHRANIQTADKLEVSPLMYAIWYNEYYTADLLLSKGADPYKADTRGYHAMDVAIWADNMDMLLLLLDYGTDPNESAKQGITPLHIASLLGYADMIDTLIAYGADVNVLNAYNQTPLTLSITNQQPVVTEQLLYAGAHTKYQEAGALQPMDLARTSQNKEAVRILKQYRARGSLLPYFSTRGITWQSTWNATDYYSGFSVVEYDTKWNLYAGVGYHFRPYRVKVLHPLQNETYLQFRERRHIWDLFIGKDIALKQKDNETGLWIDIHGMFTYGKFKGTRFYAPAQKIILSSSTGFYKKWDNMTFKLGYQYMPIPIKEISPHFMMLSLDVHFPYRSSSSFEKSSWMQ